MTKTLIILAAGLGTRYGGLKQLDSFGPNNETLMDYAIYDAIQAGFNHVIFIIRPSMEDAFRARFVQKINKYTNMAVDLAFQEAKAYDTRNGQAFEREKPWGTVHALLSTKTVLPNKPFAVINADDFYGREAFMLMSRYLEQLSNSKPNYAMIGYRLDKVLSENGAVARGLCRSDQAGFLQSIVEIKAISRKNNNIFAELGINAIPPDTLTSMNFWGLTPAAMLQMEQIFNAFLVTNGYDSKAECYISTTINQLLAQELCSVKVLPTNTQWMGVTYQEDKPTVVAALNQLTENGIYPGKLF